MPNIIKRINNGTFSISSEIEKVFIHTCIKPLDIEFDTQYYIKDIHHYCDVFIPSKNIVVEFQGDYWHGNPKKYLREELTKYQLDKVRKDEILRNYCQEHGLKLIEVWESDFKKNRESVKESIRKEIGV